MNYILFLLQKIQFYVNTLLKVYFWCVCDGYKSVLHKKDQWLIEHSDKKRKKNYLRIFVPENKLTRLHYLIISISRKTNFRTIRNEELSKKSKQSLKLNYPVNPMTKFLKADCLLRSVRHNNFLGEIWLLWVSLPMRACVSCRNI